MPRGLSGPILSPISSEIDQRRARSGASMTGAPGDRESRLRHWRSVTANGVALTHQDARKQCHIRRTRE
jgi:hypothetical protein